MLSRRNVRIKILQLLYSRSILGDQTDAQVIASYRRTLDNTFDLYLYSLYLFAKVAEESTVDKQKRLKKHLKSEEDNAFKARLFYNDIVQSLEKNENLQQRYRQLKFDDMTDPDHVRQIYLKYAKEELYLAFDLGQGEPISDLDGLLEFYRYLRKSELLSEMLEDRFYSWLDDKSLVVGAMKKTLKALPTDEDFFNDYLPDHQTTEEFGMVLLLATLQGEERMTNYIKPKLNNWDVDRLATMDMIILHMALNEMISFQSIPTKATINEYVEIAKNYSTDKSKEFVNGILDSLMKDLVEEGVIVKTGRGLK